mgnify:CR=1 FL=1
MRSARVCAVTQSWARKDRTLRHVLERLADHMEQSREVRDTLLSALIYPMILIFVAVVSIFILLGYVVPQFTQMFADVGRDLPLLTRIVAGTGELVANWWWLMLILLGADVSVDCGQTLSHGTGTIHSGLVDQLDLQVCAFGPAHDFECCTAACHTTADKKNINFFFDDFRISEFSCHCYYL